MEQGGDSCLVGLAVRRVLLREFDGSGVGSEKRVDDAPPFLEEFFWNAEVLSNFLSKDCYGQRLVGVGVEFETIRGARCIYCRRKGVRVPDIVYASIPPALQRANSSSSVEAVEIPDDLTQLAACLVGDVLEQILSRTKKICMKSPLTRSDRSRPARL